MAKVIYQAIGHPRIDEPKEDGRYIVLEYRDGKLTDIFTCEFNVGYGWNTRRGNDGTVYDECKIELVNNPFRQNYWLEKGEIYAELN